MYAANEHRYDTMPVRRAGHTGFQLPAISFGLWHHFGEETAFKTARQVLLQAFDAGIFSFDLAANYGPGSYAAEKLFGQVYRQDLKPYRDELVISTKAGFHMWPGPYGEMSSRKTLVASLDRSLKAMGLDYVDIYYSHRPDSQTDPFETAMALDDLVRQGKTLYVGISNYDLEQSRQIIRAFRELRTPFVVNQVSYNLLNRQVETSGLTDYLLHENAGVVAYGPLAEGLLTDRYLQGIPEDFRIHWSSETVFDQGPERVAAQLTALNALAINRGQTLAQLALAWLLTQPVVTSVVTGASTPEHLQDNLAAVTSHPFTADELAQIDDILA